MNPSRRALLCILAASATLGLVLLYPGQASAQCEPYENLQVLPPDIDCDTLSEVMLENLRGLGLRRFAGRGCLHCHVGSTETSMGTWDYASDAKPEKEAARVMMRMVEYMNREYVANLPTSPAPRTEITCATCHAGRTNPKPLPALLLEEYERGGIADLSTRYEALRDRFFGGRAYDFRVHVLPGVAGQLAARDDIDGALEVLELNVDAFADVPRAHRELITMQVRQAVLAGGIEAAKQRYEMAKAEHPPEAFTWLLLEYAGGGEFRAGHHAEGLELFRFNVTEYPDRFSTTFSLAEALVQVDRIDEAIQAYESWVASHPDDSQNAQERIGELNEADQ